MPLVIQLPWGGEGDFTGVIDLVQMKGLLWANDDKTAKGDVFDVVDIPAEYAEQAAEYRAKLIEQLADIDDVIAEKYLEGEELSIADIKAAIRRAILSSTIETHRHRRALRLGVQEQGRPAHARRRHRLPAVAARHRRHGRPLGQGRDRRGAPRSRSSTPRSRRWPSRSPSTRTSAS